MEHAQPPERTVGGIEVATGGGGEGTFRGGHAFRVDYETASLTEGKRGINLSTFSSAKLIFGSFVTAGNGGACGGAWPGRISSRDTGGVEEAMAKAGGPARARCGKGANSLEETPEKDMVLRE